MGAAEGALPLDEGGLVHARAAVQERRGLRLGAALREQAEHQEEDERREGRRQAGWQA